MHVTPFPFASAVLEGAGVRVGSARTCEPGTRARPTRAGRAQTG